MDKISKLLEVMYDAPSISKYYNSGWFDFQTFRDDYISWTTRRSKALSDFEMGPEELVPFVRQLLQGAELNYWNGLKDDCRLDTSGKIAAMLAILDS